jgi:hypothetical protein
VVGRLLRRGPVRGRTSPQLGVEVTGDAPGVRTRRLVARGAEVDDAEPPVCKADARFLSVPDIVGATVSHRVGHPRELVATRT